MCVDIILPRTTIETGWTQQNSLQTFIAGYFSSFKIEIGVSHCILFCVWACELLESVPGAFFVRGDHTYKDDCCKILHDVFTVQRPTVATVTQRKQQATMMCRPVYPTPSLVALVTRQTAYYDIAGRVAPVAFAWRSSIDNQHTHARRNRFDLDRDIHKKTWLGGVVTNSTSPPLDNL